MYLARVLAVVTLIAAILGQTTGPPGARGAAARLTASPGGMPATAYGASLSGTLSGHIAQLQLERGDFALGLSVSITTMHGSSAPYARSIDTYSFTIPTGDLVQQRHDLILDTGSDLASYGRVKARWHFASMPRAIVIPDTPGCELYMPPDLPSVQATASAQLDLRISGLGAIRGAVSDRHAVIQAQATRQSDSNNNSSNAIVSATLMVFGPASHPVHGPTIRTLAGNYATFIASANNTSMSHFLSVAVAAYANSAASGQRPYDLSIDVYEFNPAPGPDNLSSKGHGENDLLTVGNSTFHFGPGLKVGVTYHGPMGRLSLTFMPRHVSVHAQPGSGGTVTDKCTGKVQHLPVQPALTVKDATAATSGSVMLAGGTRYDFSATDQGEVYAARPSSAR
jgi:hypothetical protein